jgi:hypothetical protein
MTATVVSLYTEIMESGRYDFQIITFRRFRKETFISGICILSKNVQAKSEHLEFNHFFGRERQKGWRA